LIGEYGHVLIQIIAHVLEVVFKIIGDELKFAEVGLEGIELSISQTVYLAVPLVFSF
jgi:hypothetical protein